MKIGMVTACYKPLINGVTRMVALYKQHLERMGHEVTVFTLGDPDPAGEEPGVIRSPAIALGGYGYYFSMRYNREAQKLLNEMDILHCHHLLMSVEMAHRYAHCPIIYTNHTRYDLYTGTYTPFSQPTADALMRQVWPEYTDLADVVITPSESVRHVMLDFGVRQPIEMIENGVDLRPFHSPPDPHHKSDYGIPEDSTLLIYVGRLSSEKNLGILLEQFAIAQDILPELHLMLVGDGTIAAEIPVIARQLGIAKSVHLTGALSYTEVANCLAAADIFVTASVTEVHPLTVIEALAAGLPVAGTRSPGIVDTVEPGVTGFLAKEPGQGLAAAMVALASNPERLQEMRVAARLASERYDIQRTVDKTVALYERLRDTRPDLARKKEHGRWYRSRERLQPALDQLAELVRSPGDGSIWKWLGLEKPEEK